MTGLLAGTGVFALVLLLRVAGALQPGELALYDAMLRARAGANPGALPVALVLIREPDIRALGHPLTDDLLRELTSRILEAGPHAVGIDLYRDQPVPPRDGDPRLDTEAYRRLGETVTTDDRVIVTMKFPDPGSFGTPPPRFLPDDLQVGFSDLPVDPGGMIRRGLLFMWDGDRPLLSLSLQLALRRLRADRIGLGPAPDDPDEIQLGETVIPPLHEGFGPYVRVDDAGYQLLLDYGSGTREIPAFGVSEVLAGEVPGTAFRDRVVLVGTAAPSVKDSFFTPLSGGEPMYGVEVHARAVEQLIRYARGVSRPLEALAAPAVAAWILLWSLLGAFAGAWARSLTASVATGAAAVTTVVATSVLSFGAGLWVPLIAPLLAGSASAAATAGLSVIAERAQRRQLASLFSRFQTPAVAEDIWRRRAEFLGEDGRPVSRRIVVTTLMTDLEGYTAASETLDPEALMGWANEYLSMAADVVEAFGGVVDDYAGDGIKANFGFPAPSRDDAEIDAAAVSAVRAGVELGRRMSELNERWEARGLPTARVRIGIFTGPAVAGFIGGDRALKYTSVGATINTASRLEQFEKDEFAVAETSHWRLLIGEDTRRRSDGRFEIQDLGAHPLKGIDGDVPIFRVLGEREPPEPRA